MCYYCTQYLLQETGWWLILESSSCIFHHFRDCSIENFELNLTDITLSDQVIGAFWYLLAIERQNFCWRRACRRVDCDIRTLYCGEANDVSDKSFLEISCPIIEEDAPFNYGIFLRVLQSKVVNSRNFVQKLFFCFWWGLQNLR